MESGVLWTLELVPWRKIFIVVAVLLGGQGRYAALLPLGHFLLFALIHRRLPRLGFLAIIAYLVGQYVLICNPFSLTPEAIFHDVLLGYVERFEVFGVHDVLGC